MEQAYRKECWTTLGAFVLVTVLTHIFPLYFLFPGLTQMMIFGYPAHYLITIVVGWLVLIPVYWIYIGISEKIDREIEESSEEALRLGQAQDIDGMDLGRAAE